MKVVRRSMTVTLVQILAFLGALGHSDSAAFAQARTQPGCCLLRTTWPFPSGYECKTKPSQLECARDASGAGLPVERWDFFPDTECGEIAECPSFVSSFDLESDDVETFWISSADHPDLDQAADANQWGVPGGVTGRTLLSYDALTGPRLGVGVDLELGIVKPHSCITSREDIPTARTIGESRYSSQHIVDAETVARVLDISVSFAVRLEVAGGGGTSRLVRETVSSASSDVYHAALDVSAVPPNLVLEPELTAADRSLSDLDFRQRCGDGYIHAIHYGGKLSIFFEHEELSLTEKSVLSNAGDGKYVAYQGNHEVTLTLQRLEKEGRTKISYVKVGTRGGLVPSSLEEVRQAVAEFEREVVAHPSPVSFLVIPYSELGRRVSVPKTDHEKMAILLLRLVTLGGLVADVARNPAGFHVDETFQLDVLQESILDDVRTLRGALKECVASNGASCEMPEGYSLMREWDYRAQFPAIRGGATDMELGDAMKALARVKEKLKTLERVRRSCPATEATRGRGEFTYNRNPACERIHYDLKRAKESVKRSMARLAPIRNRRPEALREERFKKWIQEPNDIRCTMSGYEDCLGLEELNALRGRGAAFSVAGTSPR